MRLASNLAKGERISKFSYANAVERSIIKRIGNFDFTDSLSKILKLVLLGPFFVSFLGKQKRKKLNGLNIDRLYLKAPHE